MNKYCIRYNKTRGQEGRGTESHVWRVFENGVELLAKDVVIEVRSWTEKTDEDWSICCNGFMWHHEPGGFVIIKDTPF